MIKLLYFCSDYKKVLEIKIEIRIIVSVIKPVSIFYSFSFSRLVYLSMALSNVLQVQAQTPNSSFLGNFSLFG